MSQLVGAGKFNWRRVSAPGSCLGAKMALRFCAFRDEHE